MSDRLTIELQDAELLRRLADAQRQLADPSELLDAIGALLEGNTAMRLDDFKADPAGNPWAPIKPATERALRRKNSGSIPGSLLIRAAQGMRAGLTHNLVGDDAVEIGFDKPYAIYHEFGTRRMPRRGLLTANPETGELGAEDREDVLDLVNRFLEDLL